MEIVALESRVDDDTILVGVVGREGIAAFGVTPAHRQLVCLSEGGAQHGVLPVGALSECCYLLVGVSALVVEISLLETGPLACRHEVEFLGGHVEACRVAVVDGGASACTFLGGDDDHAVGAARAVDGRGAHILEHLYRFDVGWVDGRKRIETALHCAQSCLCGACVLVVDKTVYHVKGLVARVDRVAAADAYLRGGARLSRRCRDVQSGHRAVECAFKGRRGGFLEERATQLRHGARQLGAFLCAVSHDHHLVEVVGRVGLLVVKGVDRFSPRCLLPRQGKCKGYDK